MSLIVRHWLSASSRRARAKCSSISRSTVLNFHRNNYEFNSSLLILCPRRRHFVLIRSLRDRRRRSHGVPHERRGRARRPAAPRHRLPGHGPAALALLHLRFSQNVLICSITQTHITHSSIPHSSRVASCLPSIPFHFPDLSLYSN